MSGINNSFDQLKYQGKIMVDSGGFQLCKSRYISTNRMNGFSQKNILNLQLNLNIDYAVSLDYPISPFEEPEIHRKRIIKSIQNVKTCVKTVNEKQIKSPKIIPVIHGYDKKKYQIYM